MSADSPAAGTSGNGRTRLRNRGPVGYRTGGPDGPIARAGRRKVAESTGWTLSIAGLTFLAGGLALADSDMTVRALAIIVGLSSIGQGVLRVIATHREQADRRTRLRDDIIGAVLIGIGTLCLVSPSVGQRGLLVGTAVWFALVGIQELLDSSRGHRCWPALLFVNCLAIAATLVLNPDMTLAALSRLVAVGLLVRGVLLVGKAWHDARPATGSGPDRGGGPRTGAVSVVAAAALAALAIPVLIPAPASATAPATLGNDAEGVLTSVAVNPTGLGYWVQRDNTVVAVENPEQTTGPNYDRNGSTLALGGAPEFKNKDKAGVIVANPVGSGYWIVGNDGKISARGSAAQFCADLADCSGYSFKNKAIDNWAVGNNTIVASAATPTGRGLWAVDETGAVWTAGDARPKGDVKRKALEDEAPTGIFSSSTGNGYTIVLQDGGVHTFGDALYFGHGGAGSGDAVGIAPSLTPTGAVNGYWIVNDKGTVTPFGKAPRIANASSGTMVTGIAALTGGRGYIIVRRDGTTQTFTTKPQRWVEIQTGGNYLQVTSDHSDTQIHGKPDHGTLATMWREVAKGGGYQLVNARSGLCLDTDTGLVTQRPCSNAKTQQFTVNERTPGKVTLKTTTGGLEYHPEYGYQRAVAVARATLVEWDVAPVVNGPVSLTDNDGLALDVQAESTTAGAHVIGWPDGGRPNQIWFAQIAAPGEYQLKNQQSSLCLDDNGGLPEQQPCDGSAAQSFEAIRHGNRVVLATTNGYLSLDKGGPGGVARAAMNAYADNATQWRLTFR